MNCLLVRCAVLSLSLAITATAVGQPNRPRAAPWEIEPTLETKRRIEEGIFEFGFDSQIVLSVRVGEVRTWPLKRDALSIDVANPKTASSFRSARRGASRSLTLRGLTQGSTSVTVNYAAETPGEEMESI